MQSYNISSAAVITSFSPSTSPWSTLTGLTFKLQQYSTILSISKYGQKFPISEILFNMSLTQRFVSLQVNTCTYVNSCVYICLHVPLYVYVYTHQREGVECTASSPACELDSTVLTGGVMWEVGVRLIGHSTSPLLASMWRLTLSVGVHHLSPTSSH